MSFLFLVIARVAIQTLPQAVEKRSLKFLGTQFEEILNFLFSQGKVLFNFT